MSLPRFFVSLVTALPLFFLGAPAASADVPLHPVEPGGEFPSFHAEELLRHQNTPPALPGVPSPYSARTGSAGPDRTVYGYWPYWGDPISTIPFDSLTHVAIFSVSLTSSGGLTNTAYWTNYAAEAVSLAHPYGVKVHMCVTCMDSSIMSSVFPSATNRARAVGEIRDLIEAYGADGANIDVEGLPSSLKADFVTFISELQAEVPEVYIATPAVDWSGAFDYDLLAAYSSGLFIMGYGYHWSGGNPGPIAPLFGGSPWSVYSLEWTVDDYITWGAPLDKIVLGLPLYGYDWPTTNTNVPGTSTGSGSAVVYTSAVSKGLQYGRYWDTVTHTPYAFPDSVSQLWYDDQESIEDKVSWGLEQDLQGVGFWALTYEDADPAFWGMIDGLTYEPEPTCDMIDADADGVDACEDCDDTNPDVNPYLSEMPGDGIDNDCDGVIDEPPSPSCQGNEGAGAPFGALTIAFVGFLGLYRRRRA